MGELESTKKLTSCQNNIPSTTAIAYMLLLSHGPSAILEIFSEFLIFCNIFHEPLGKWNNSKIWEARKVFANIAQRNAR